MKLAHKTLANLLIQKYLPNCEVSKMASGMLKLPDVNHARAEIKGMVDRFLISDENIEMILNEYREDNDFYSQARSARPPLNPMWLETLNLGFLVHGDIFYHFRKIEDVLIFVCSFQSHFEEGETEANFNKLLIKELDPGTDSELVKGTKYAWQILALCFAKLTQPHAATVERVIPFGDTRTPEARAMHRRLQQRHGGVFSYNVVNFVVPQPSAIGGTVRERGGMAEKRWHQVVGHWRLINNKVEPYWTWVEGHSSGNAELGVIVKERHVRFVQFEIRNGFLVPNFNGKKGERVKAHQNLEVAV